MSVFSKKSSLSARTSLSKQSSLLPGPARLVNLDREKNVRFELLKNVDVKSVLQNVYQEQKQKDYDVLIRVIKDADSVVQDKELLKLLKAATDSIQYLNEKLKLFVQVLLAFKWFHRGDRVLNAYQEFIVELIRKQPFYLDFLIEQLLLCFSKVSETDKDKVNEWRDSFPPAVDRKGYINVHSLFSFLLTNGHITGDQIVEKIWLLYPHSNCPCSFLAYTHNLLEMCLYVGCHRKQILNFILQKLIQLDTLASKCDIEKANADHEENRLDSAEVFNMDEDTSSSNGDVMHHTIANLLDICLLRFFKFIQQVCWDKKYHPTPKDETISKGGNDGGGAAAADNGKKNPKRSSTSVALSSQTTPSLLNEYNNLLENVRPLQYDTILVWDKTKALFNELLALFETILLPTYGLTHVSFLVMYFCSFKLSLAEAFVEFLWKKIVNVNIYNIFRQTCCQYVSSMLIHANFIPVRVLKTCLNEMTQWLHSYLDKVDLSDDENYCVIAKHSVFFSVCQTVFAVLTYKHSVLVDCKKNMKFVQSLNLQRLVMSTLNPLRFCNKEIVSHFAHVTKKYQIVYCYNIMHENARLNVLPVVSVDHLGNLSKLNTLQTLDHYSPFSTFLLVRCKRLITPEMHCSTTDAVDILNSTDDADEFRPHGMTNDVSATSALHTIDIRNDKRKMNSGGGGIAIAARMADDDDDFLMSVDSPCPSLNITNMSVSA